MGGAVDTLLKCPEFKELEFDEVTHTYSLNGETLPSVTRIMEPLKTAQYDGVSEKTLSHAAARGTTVHNAIENWILFGIEDVPEEHKGYFDAFRLWWEDSKPEVIGTEVRVYHKLMRYAGTGDLLARVNGLTDLIDYKTTYAVNEMLCKVQLEAYNQAFASHGFKVDGKAILHLKKTGKYSLHEYPLRDARCWKVFGGLKDVYDYTQSYR